MHIHEKYIEYIKLLKTSELMESCRFFFDRATGEMVIISSLFFREVNYIEFDELLSQFPEWWIAEMLPKARVIHENRDNRFIEIPSTLAN
ncbi:MAG: hypothetical protein JJT76_09605 [Clostridiaceae bacterium]|nr:hypothetical protein [Clostridiaceae bacterium]